jgi:protein-arginine kinase activator protein McsA
MICENCRKREATTFIVAVKGDGTKEVNLCEDCYKQSEYGPVIAGVVQAGWTSYNPLLGRTEIE